MLRINVAKTFKSGHVFYNCILVLVEWTSEGKRGFAVGMHVSA